MRFATVFATLLAMGCSFILSAAEPTLDIVFDKVQTVKFKGGKSIQFDGPVKALDGGKAMAFGNKGYQIPVAGKIGEQGTFILKFAIAKKMLQSESAARSLAVLRLKGREEIGYYTFRGNPTLQHRFADQSHNFYGQTETLKPEKIYCAAFVWDGSRIYCYLDGKLTQEEAQPFPVDAKRVNEICVGPYNDGYYSPAPWPDDTYISEIRLYDRPLSGDEIAAFSGVKTLAVHERYPRVITAPKRTSDAVRGTSYITLVNQTALAKTWELPANSGNFAWDDQNLYINFATSFPGNTVIKKGSSPDDPESGVWGSEDFELLIRHSGKTYYFAGSVNGGKCEMRDQDSSYNPKWDYQSSLSMRIDDTSLWTGKIAIPWKALELNAPPKDGVTINFCRSFFNSAVTAVTDMAGNDDPDGQGYWTDNSFFYNLKLGENVPSLTTVRLGNPSYGNMDQEFELTSPVDAKVKFEIIQEHEKGLIRPQSLISNTYELKANQPLTVTVQMPLTTTQTDRLVYRLSDAAGKNVYFCQDVPVKVAAEYLTITPLFTAGKIDADVKCSMLQTKYGKNAKFTLVLKNAKGEKIYAAPQLKEKLAVPFAKNNPAGMYKLEILTAQNETVSVKEFFFPGFGEWSKMQFDMTRILPPFTEMSYSNQGGFNANVVLRTYQWNRDSIFPAQIISKGDKLFTAPAELYVDGKPLKGAFKSTSTLKHRAEMTATAKNALCQVKSSGWLEYDGVQHNEVEFKALQNIGKVELRITMPRKFVKYLHTSSCGWGAKVTAEIKDGKQSFRYFPVVFLGNEEKGFCFFAESCADWVNAPAQPLTVDAGKETATFTVSLASDVKRGQTLHFDCGFIGTPVKPLHAIHPMNTAGDHYSFGMKRASQKMQVVWCGYLEAPPSSFLSDAFCDVPGVNNAPLEQNIQAQVAFAKKNGVHPFVYTPNYITHEYPEVQAFSTEWETVPRQLWGGKRGNKQVTLALLCPASQGADFTLYHMKKYLEKNKVDGFNFDFGIVPVCNNAAHGCHNRTPLIAYRNFFRKVAMLLLDSGAPEYVIHVHNTDSVQIPAYTFVTHLLNGEHIRQQSSPLMHNGKDILDTYPLKMFACELNTLPFGIYNAAYQSNDVLNEEYGGGKEDPELYKLRITRAFLTGMVVHNSIAALDRCHYGIFDKLMRIYEKFEVPKCEFIGYWDERKAAEVTSGQGVLASLYRHPDGKRLLAVVSHIGNERLNQDVTITFRPEVLKMGALHKATEHMDADDPAYEELYKLREVNHQPSVRIPLKWQNAGIKVLDFKDNTLKLHLPAHTFALVELE